MTSIDERLQKVVEDCFLKPILRLKETHPEYSFTEQGFGTLTDNAITEIKKAFVEMLPEERDQDDSYNDTSFNRFRGWNQYRQAILTKLEVKK